MYIADKSRYEKMRFNRCGDSGLKLPAVSLGLWHNFGSTGVYANMVKMCLTAFTPMIDTMRVIPENMRKAAAGGFINATDCADYLVKKGLPFRDAYKATGTLVALCIDKKTTLEELPIEEYQKVCELFDEGVYEAISLENCVNGRRVLGGPAGDNVRAQAKRVQELLKD